MWYPLLDAYLFSYKRDVRFIALENAFEKESFSEFFGPPLVNKARARCPSKDEKHFWCFGCSLFIYLFCLCFRFLLYISFSQERTNSRISCFNRQDIPWWILRIRETLLIFFSLSCAGFVQGALSFSP